MISSGGPLLIYKADDFKCWASSYIASGGLPHIFQADDINPRTTVVLDQVVGHFLYIKLLISSGGPPTPIIQADDFKWWATYQCIS